MGSGTGGLGQSSVELSAADAKQLCRLGHVAVCPSQGLLDQGDFGLGQVEGQTLDRNTGRNWRRWGRRLQVQVLWLDVGPAAFDEGTFYDVFEFADITGESVRARLMCVLIHTIVMLT